jgi:hypothetical protein
MGTTLTGTKPKDTYDSLIKVTDNGPISGTAKYLSDGLGNDSVLALSTSKVGIATNTPAVELHVETSGTGTTAMSNVITTLRSKAAGRDIDIQFSDGTNQAYIGSLSGAFYIGTGGANERLRITSAGVVELTQGQIQFPATQVASANANTLDDYEEGTWTMGVSFGGGATGITYNHITGNYVKIGRQVNVTGLISLTNKGSSTGDARITGLPFAIPNAVPNYAAPSLMFFNIGFANQFQAYGVIGSSTIALFEITEAGAASGLTNADFANNSEVIISFTYQV